MISQHHEEAKAAGVKIINCCGFDSIPAGRSQSACCCGLHIRMLTDQRCWAPPDPDEAPCGIAMNRAEGLWSCVTPRGYCSVLGDVNYVISSIMQLI